MFNRCGKTSGHPLADIPGIWLLCAGTSAKYLSKYKHTDSREGISTGSAHHCWHAPNGMWSSSRAGPASGLAQLPPPAATGGGPRLSERLCCCSYDGIELSHPLKGHQGEDDNCMSIVGWSQG